MCIGHVYFNCYPNYSLSLHDPNIQEALALNIQTQGYDMLPRSMNLCVIYRICFKAMTNISPNSRIESHKGKTTLFQIDINKTNISIPKTITWNEIDLPQSWKLENVIPPKILRQTTEKIIKNNNGDIEIIFSRPSVSLQPSISNRNSFDEGSSSVKGIYISEHYIPHGIYSDKPTMS